MPKNKTISALELFCEWVLAKLLTNLTFFTYSQVNKIHLLMAETLKVFIQLEMTTAEDLFPG
jgi:hypothetical protein